MLYLLFRYIYTENNLLYIRQVTVYFLFKYIYNIHHPEALYALIFGITGPTHYERWSKLVAATNCSINENNKIIGSSCSIYKVLHLYAMFANIIWSFQTIIIHVVQFDLRQSMPHVNLVQLFHLRGSVCLGIFFITAWTNGYTLYHYEV